MQLVSDITPDAQPSDPLELVDVNGTLFFTADDGVHGREFWRTDGTRSGTVLVKEIAPGRGGAPPRFLTNVNGTLFFSAPGGSMGGEGQDAAQADDALDALGGVEKALSLALGAIANSRAGSSGPSRRAVFAVGCNHLSSSDQVTMRGRKTPQTKGWRWHR